jgi:hypothetical protein
MRPRPLLIYGKPGVWELCCMPQFMFFASSPYPHSPPFRGRNLTSDITKIAPGPRLRGVWSFNFDLYRSLRSVCLLGGRSFELRHMRVGAKRLPFRGSELQLRHMQVGAKRLPFRGSELQLRQMHVGAKRLPRCPRLSRRSETAVTSSAFDFLPASLSSTLNCCGHTLRLPQLADSTEAL